MTKRERILLWELMESSIHRYLMDNADGRQCGIGKAEGHNTLCEIFLIWHLALDRDNEDKHCIQARFEKEYWAVHDQTQELTSYLDEVIGFPLKGRPDYDTLAPKFFDKFIKLAVKALRGLKTEKGEG